MPSTTDGDDAKIKRKNAAHLLSPTYTPHHLFGTETKKEFRYQHPHRQKRSTSKWGLLPRVTSISTTTCSLPPSFRIRHVGRLWCRAKSSYDLVLLVVMRLNSRDPLTANNAAETIGGELHFCSKHIATNLGLFICVHRTAVDWWFVAAGRSLELVLPR